MRRVLVMLAALTACDGGAGDDDATTDTDPTDTDDGDDDPIAGLTDELVPHVLRRHDGRWIVAGEEDGDLVVAAFDDSLRPDASFGDDGRVRLDFGGDPGGVLRLDLDAAWALHVDDDGMWAGGYGAAALLGADGDFGVARLTSDGTPDTAFDDDGLVLTDWTVDSAVNALVPTDDGGVIALGFLLNSPSRDVAGARYDAAGAVVADWGTDGTGIVADDGGSESALAAIPDGDGVLAVVGAGFRVARFQVDSGDLDTAWATDGWTDAVDGVAYVALEDDDDLVLVGTWNDGDTSRLRVVRRTRDGALDTGFSDDGIADVTLPFDLLDTGTFSVDSAVVRVRGAGVTSDGGLAVYVQAAALTGQAPALVRLTAEGELDAGWQSGGGLALPGAFALLEGADVLSDSLLVMDGDDAVIVDSRLRDADGGGVEAFLVTERHPM